ncbi:SAM-dependent methyltransferase [Streptomyces sp. DSM 44917]|uniref:SAM-dependent methyltransferase n=1 Tax=Streptomyces boetiae TaxID=3075541 RepID=A0ABU2LFZ4_9ACTN|nr:SAM-dependent methyltransferase [Streptomyces sp. DSM 44917]MDT0310436.1 SAM-dependent methyltransferase [Streptomyces sp. DSM 44917]
MTSDRPVPGVDAEVPHSARVWNYWLGGKDNYASDRRVGDEFRAVFPGIDVLARASRYFLARAVRYLAGEAGIRQFLDIGTGLPTADNTHEIAQRVAPDSRVVYVDNDPLILLHARALLTSTPQGVTEYLDADLHDPAGVLRQAAGTLDLRRPVALTLMQTLGHVADLEEARAIVRGFLDLLPSGSYLALNDSVTTHRENAEATRIYNESGALPYHLRPPEEIASFFEGLEPVPPGVVPIATWRPDVEDTDATRGAAWGGVGRKP